MNDFPLPFSLKFTKGEEGKGYKTIYLTENKIDF